MRKRVVIDCFPESAARYRQGYAVVAIDVVRATTTAITVAAAGVRCFPVPTLKAAFKLADTFGNALLAGELRGIIPPGFAVDNSPTEVLAHIDTARPVILLSSTGTRLCHESAKCEAAFLACLRNYVSVADYLAENFANIAVIGAGSRGEFREEDQMCCAWVAERLVAAGYSLENRTTMDIVKLWSKAPVDSWIENKSASFLRSNGYLADLEFILNHVADLNALFTLQNGEVLMDRDRFAMRA
jgi:2-phosphosulfolactate phosphatase